MILFSEMIRRARTTRNMTLAQLSELVGFHQSHLSLVERGQRRLDEGGVLRIAEVLGLDATTAILAFVREQVSADKRHLVPEATPTDEIALLRGTRKLQQEHFDFEVQKLAVDIEVDWDGNLRTTRTFDGCRPTSNSRAVWEVMFGERVAGVSPNSDAPPAKFSIREAPGNLEFTTNSTEEGVWRRHRLCFPRGWRRHDRAETDTLSFAFETYQESAYCLDATATLERASREGLHNPLLQAYNFYVKYHLDELEIRFSFPAPYCPERWEPWCWWGSGALEATTRNLVGGCVSASFEMKSEANHAELVAKEPLAGYTHSLVWVPASRQRYLDARYGGVADVQG